MAEHGSAGSDDERNHMDDDDDEPSSSSSNSSGHVDDHVQLKNLINEKLSDLTNKHEDVDDDELERLARINAKFNCSNLTDKPLKPKGTTVRCGSRLAVNPPVTYWNGKSWPSLMIRVI